MKKIEYVYKFSTRDFLNKDPDSKISAIGINFSREVGDNWSNAEFKISDCSKTIALDLDFETDEDIEASIYKLEVIRKSCTKALKYIKENKELLLLKEDKIE